jgi:endonuclease-3
MRRQDKADRIGALLDSLYPEPPVPLQHADPYTLLVAVVLSAQCTDERVNLVTPGLFAAADTPARMAALSEKEILQHIRSCGLAPGKAKNIRNLSRILVEKHGGQVPRDEAALEALPGVGHKTAGVVMVQAFGVPAFPVDTHIHRLAGRWGLSRARNVVETERDLQALFPRQTWSRAHLQIIYFGREHCPARGHDFERCPICCWAASKRRMRAELAARRASTARRIASIPRQGAR